MTTSSWADDLFRAGPSHPAKVYKALAEILHPNNGGQEDLYRELCAAYDRHRATHTPVALHPEDSGDADLYRDLCAAHERLETG